MTEDVKCLEIRPPAHRGLRPGGNAEVPAVDGDPKVVMLRWIYQENFTYRPEDNIELPPHNGRGKTPPPIVGAI
jgi:hypothetical protein